MIHKPPTHAHTHTAGLGYWVPGLERGEAPHPPDDEQPSPELYIQYHDLAYDTRGRNPARCGMSSLEQLPLPPPSPAGRGEVSGLDWIASRRKRYRLVWSLRWWGIITPWTLQNVKVFTPGPMASWRFFIFIFKMLLFWKAQEEGRAIFPPMPKARRSLRRFKLGSEVRFAPEPQSLQPLVWSRASETAWPLCSSIIPKEECAAARMYAHVP